MIINVNDIDSKTEEGKLLIAAIGMIMCQKGWTDKTPEDIIEELTRRTAAFLSRK